MTQLLIAGVEVVLPQNFACTVKRENSFFTKNGEYSYDVNLKLDNPTNRALYGFLQRLNKAEQLDVKRPAVLMADGRVYARGTEIITQWTNEDVTIQIVSGESELNYFIGQDRKIEDLDLGDTGNIRHAWYDGNWPESFQTDDYCLPMIQMKSGRTLNGLVFGYDSEDEPYTDPHNPDLDEPGGNYHTYLVMENVTPQPYLCALLERIIEALGYNAHDSHYEMVNQLRDSEFANLFLVNTIQTTNYAKMLPGWTVKEFFEEVEKLTGCVFVVRNSDGDGYPKCDIMLSTSYYLNANQYTVRNITDAYESNVEDDDSRLAVFTTSDVTYDMPDHYLASLMKLPEGILESAEIRDVADIAELKTAMDAISYKDKVIFHNVDTNRYYVKMALRERGAQDDLEYTRIVEVDQFRNLDRENTTSTLELKITPVPMQYRFYPVIEIPCFYDGSGMTDTTPEEEEEKDFTEQIRDYKKDESESVDLYCAFYNDTLHYNGTYYIPVAYTDDYHCTTQSYLHNNASITGNTPEGSLRLNDIEVEYYHGAYQIDTAHAMTFETYDPNVIDPRQVYVIKNRRFVVRDVEETLTAEGRQKRWKLTCYPITITDTALENRWVLTDGVWDDGGAWLDDGRWLDGE